MTELLKRREQVAKLYLEGRTIRQIAQDLGVSIGTVHADLQYIEKEWATLAEQSVSKRKTDILAKLDLIEKMAYEAFEKSQGEIVVETQRARTKAGSGAKEIIKQEVRSMSPGDPRYLQIVGNCISQRAKLIGLLPKGGSSETGHLPVIGFEVVADTLENEMNEISESDNHDATDA
ncbi:MAG: response regulator transcription factor [Planctomycetia bacterium]|nr:response regulator transcription factor [Planctomycetia bacterium]